VRGEQDEVVWQAEQLLGERAVQRPGHVIDGVHAACVQVRPAGVADEQRIAREDEPRVSRACMVGHDVGVMSRSVTGRRDGLKLGVAELDELLVGKRMMVEVDPGSGGQVCRCAGALDEAGKSGDVVGLEVCFDHRDDARALPLRERAVVVDEIDVGVDDCEFPGGLAPEHVRGARGVFVEQLTEVHPQLRRIGMVGLTSYQVIY
jgi:hypothetical protein